MDIYKEPSIDLIEIDKEISINTLELMKVDYINESYIRDDETYNKIIKNTIINLEKEEIDLDINKIRNEIKIEKQLNIPLLLLLSSLI